MSARRLMDTNLIVRHLVQDHERHAKTAARLFEACDRGDLALILLSPVVAETVFVLESFYKKDRTDVARVLSALIGSPGIELVDAEIHLDALDRYSKSKVHFVDCIIAAHAASTGLPVATFESDFKRFGDVSVEID